MSGPAFALAIDSRMALLSLAGICKNFAGLEVLRNVQLKVEPGERRAIIGPNGAGKTTLFNIVSGELKPSSGTIELESQPVTGLAPEKMPTHCALLIVVLALLCTTPNWAAVSPAPSPSAMIAMVVDSPAPRLTDGGLKLVEVALEAARGAGGLGAGGLGAGRLGAAHPIRGSNTIPSSRQIPPGQARRMDIISPR